MKKKFQKSKICGLENLVNFSKFWSNFSKFALHVFHLFFQFRFWYSWCINVPSIFYGDVVLLGSFLRILPPLFPIPYQYVQEGIINISSINPIAST